MHTSFQHNSVRHEKAKFRGLATHCVCSSVILSAFLFAVAFFFFLLHPSEVKAATVREARLLNVFFDASSSQPEQDAVASRFNGYWLLNARDLSHPSDEGLTADYVRISRREPPYVLEAASLSEMVDAWPEDEPLIIFIHGNLGTEEVALRHGDLLHGLLPSQDVSSYQLAVWAWRSDREIRRTLPDAKIKAARTNEEAYRLAVFLRELPPDREVIFFGYSFGARIACGALHLLEGGVLEGRTLDASEEGFSDTSIEEKRWTLYLLASPMDADWFRPGALYGETLNNVEEVFVTHNRRDRVLKMFSNAELPGRKRMMGVLRNPCTLGNGFQPRWIDLTGEVGFRHGFARSSESPSFRRSLHELLAPTPTTLLKED